MSESSDPQSVKAVTIKNYRPAPQISEETTAFAATIYLDGKRAGTAMNEGQGGPNRYDFADRDLFNAFLAYAKAWGEANDERSEPEDALIGQLCEDYELAKQARRLIRSGATTVVFIEKTPGWFTDDHSRKPDYYQDSYLIGLRTGEDPETVAKAENADTWRVISTD